MSLLGKPEEMDLQLWRQDVTSACIRTALLIDAKDGQNDCVDICTLS